MNKRPETQKSRVQASWSTVEKTSCWSLHGPHSTPACCCHPHLPVCCVPTCHQSRDNKKGLTVLKESFMIITSSLNQNKGKTCRQLRDSRRYYALRFHILSAKLDWRTGGSGACCQVWECSPAAGSTEEPGPVDTAVVSARAAGPVSPVEGAPT